MTKFGIHSKTTHELCYDAVLEALDDADMLMSEIDEIVLSKNDSANDGERQRLFPGMLSSMLQDQDIPITRVIAACGGGGSRYLGCYTFSEQEYISYRGRKINPTSN